MYVNCELLKVVRLTRMDGWIIFKNMLTAFKGGSFKTSKKPQISKGTASQIKDLYSWPVFNSGCTTAIKERFYALNIFRFCMKLTFL